MKTEKQIESSCRRKLKKQGFDLAKMRGKTPIMPQHRYTVFFRGSKELAYSPERPITIEQVSLFVENLKLPKAN